MAFSGWPPRLTTSAGRCSSASGVCLHHLTYRFPQDGSHEYIGVNNQRLTWHSVSFRRRPGAPGRDHFVQVLRGGAHGFQLSLAISLLCRDVEARSLAVAHDCLSSVASGRRRRRRGGPAAQAAPSRVMGESGESGERRRSLDRYTIRGAGAWPGSSYRLHGEQKAKYGILSRVKRCRVSFVDSDGL
jgi:hypothetical protein